ncbi:MULTISPECIES: BON domain-containing protein [Candidatus Ichthyocystis]|uniref:BON domain-containing protein n=1 Tax=Candidatus Ichthyocystis TaxID=2929841 RepID=UPI000B83B922|nr:MULTISPECIES: BON domain-containing protein [Ichthyocystis]
MRNNLPRWVVLLLSVYIAVPMIAFLGGCGGVTVIGGTSSVVNSSRLQADVEAFDRSVQLNVKSAINRALHSRGHVEVTVYNGTVLLTGQVISREDKTRVNHAVSRVRRVHKLVSELTISSETTIMQRARNYALADNIRSDLSKVGDRFPYIVHVVTEDGVVYLMGIVTREEADAALTYVGGITGVKRVVDVFEIVSKETAKLLDARYLSHTRQFDVASDG